MNSNYKKYRILLKLFVGIINLKILIVVESYKKL